MWKPGGRTCVCVSVCLSEVMEGALFLLSCDVLCSLHRDCEGLASGKGGQSWA